MNRWLRSRGIVALISGGAGCALAGAPHEWIERWLGWGPDGGNGSVEFLVAATFFAAGIALTIDRFVKHANLRGGTARPHAARRVDESALDERHGFGVGAVDTR